MKRKILALLGIASPALSFAADGDLDPSVSTTISTLATGAKNVVSAVMSPLSDVLIAVFGIVALWFAFKLFRRVLGR